MKNRSGHPNQLIAIVTALFVVRLGRRAVRNLVRVSVF